MNRTYQNSLCSLNPGIAFKYNGKEFMVIKQETYGGCMGCCFYDIYKEEQTCNIHTGPKCWNKGEDFIFEELP